MFAFRLDPAENLGVGVAFTDREGGVSPGSFGLNLGRPDADDPARVLENVRRVRNALGAGPLAAVRQVHGAAVHEVTAEAASRLDDNSYLGDELPGCAPLPVADALVTRFRGVTLSVRAADCVPVALADAAAGVVGVAHAGRVGLLGGVLQASVQRLRELGGRELVAWVGPHVCGSCYELPAQLADEVAGAIPAAAATTTWGTPAADLGAGAEAILAALGCRVIRVGGCTFESLDLHSHRRDGAAAGRMAGLVWLGAGSVS